MSDVREHDIIKAFVDLSNELADTYDILELLGNLTTNAAHLLDVASAGLLLADQRGVLHLAAASSERTHELEVFQLQRAQGPCLDCYRTGELVTVANLADEKQRWPQFTAAAQSLGFGSVHAVPMQLRGNRLGALGLFGDRPGLLGAGDLALAQALVHVASVAIVNEKSAADRDLVNAQLQHALNSRVVLEQAKGVLAHAGRLDMDDAFTVLRRYAREHGEQLSVVARRVVQRDLHHEVVLNHARSAKTLP